MEKYQYQIGDLVFCNYKRGKLFRDIFLVVRKIPFVNDDYLYYLKFLFGKSEHLYYNRYKTSFGDNLELIC